MDLTYTDIVYLVFALEQILQKDMSMNDRNNYRSLLYRLKVSEKGKKIREAFKVERK